MFVRTKSSGAYQYLQVVENERIDGQVRQRVIGTLGRLDVLQAKGQVDGLISSCARFAQKVSVLDAYRRQALPVAQTIKIGPPLVFERLWQELNLPEILNALLAGRRYGFAVERAIFLTVLHRLMVSGSDRAAEQWSRDYAIAGLPPLQLHHLYRAMAGWASGWGPTNRRGPRALPLVALRTGSKSCCSRVVRRCSVA